MAESKTYKGSLLISGLALFSIGLVFLLDNLQLIDISVVWPIIPISIGAGMIVHHYLHNFTAKK